VGREEGEMEKGTEKEGRREEKKGGREEEKGRNRGRDPISTNKPRMVASACHPSYAGGIGRRISVQAGQAKTKKTKKTKKPCDVKELGSNGKAPAQQAQGPEFKPWLKLNKQIIQDFNI
jgi:hypothetical protein